MHESAISNVVRFINLEIVTTNLVWNFSSLLKLFEPILSTIELGHSSKNMPCIRYSSRNICLKVSLRVFQELVQMLYQKHAMFVDKQTNRVSNLD